jgi:hypothetical protein
MGYAVCQLACLIPPVWFRIMNPLALEANKLGKPTQDQFEKSKWILEKFIMVQCIVMTSVLFL